MISLCIFHCEMTNVPESTKRVTSLIRTSTRKLLRHVLKRQELMAEHMQP